MKYDKNIRPGSSLSRTMVRVGIIAGLVASVVVIARMITGRNRHGL